MSIVHYNFSLLLQIIPQKCLEVFTPSELVLLISGVPEIDVDDWERNTRVSETVVLHTHNVMRL